MASATNSGRGGGGPQTGKGASAGERGGNRGPQQDKGGKSGSGPRSGHQSHGADPNRGQPG